jgi:hypothetical protein
VTEDTPMWLTAGKYRIRFMYKPGGVVYNVLYKEAFEQDSNNLISNVRKVSKGIITQPYGTTAPDLLSSCVHYVCSEYIKNEDKGL